MKTLSRFLLACALTLAGGGAFAQVAAADSAFQKFFVSVTGVGRQTVGYGSGGQPVITQGVPQISTAGGPVLVDRGVTLANNSGGQLTTNARVSIPPAVLGQIIRRGLLGASVLGAGVALYDVARELGFTPTRASDGSVVVTKPDPTVVCTVAPCFEYIGQAGLPTLVWRYSAAQACQNWAAYYGFPYVGVTGSGASVLCRYTQFGNTNQFTLTSRSAPVQTGTPLPSSMTELEAAIAAQSGWPSSSRVSRAVADATAQQPAPSFPATPTVTGPATSPGNTTSRTNPDGSTTTITQTYNHTYSGPNINTTTTTTSSTCTGGSCNTTTTIETPTVEQQPFEMSCGLPGQAPCAVKVDETGTPTTVPELADPQQLAEESLDPISGSESPTFWPSLPAVSWSFALPSACSVIPLPAFAPFMPAVDVCQFQPMFHDIMTVVWLLGGLFGLIALFWRNAMSPVPA